MYKNYLKGNNLTKEKGGKNMSRTLRNQKINQFVYYSIGGVLIAVIVFILVLNAVMGRNKNSNNTQISDDNLQSIATEETNKPVGKNIEESKKEEEVKVEITDDTQAEGELSKELSQINNETQENENTTENVSFETASNDNLVEAVNEEIATNNQAESTDENKEEVKDPTFVMPVNGEIVKSFGKDKLIYSNTLQEWTTHLGIDIKADKTTVVKSAADGVVKSIKNDPRYGLTIVVEHQNGFSSVYSNLLTAEFVVAGENVKSGQTLGTVGNSATFEILDDAHLHFEILKDGVAVDPEMYVK